MASINKIAQIIHQKICLNYQNIKETIATSNMKRRLLSEFW